MAPGVWPVAGLAAVCHIHRGSGLLLVGCPRPMPAAKPIVELVGGVTLCVCVPASDL